MHGLQTDIVVLLLGIERCFDYLGETFSSEWLPVVELSLTKRSSTKHAEVKIESVLRLCEGI